MRSLALWGGFGGMNLGDEAILEAVVNGLGDALGIAPKRVLLLKSPPADVATRYRRLGLAPVALSNPPAVLRTLATHDLVVGGGQLVDDHGYIWPVGATVGLVLVNRALGRRPSLIGIGATPLRRLPHRLAIRYGFRVAAFIACRDRQSKECLVDAGLEEWRVNVTEDVVLTSWPDARIPDTAPDSFRIALAPAWDPQRVVEDASPDYLAVIESAIAAFGSVHVSVVAHDTRHDYDIRAARSLMDAVAREFPQIKCSLITPTDVDALRDHYRTVDAVCSTRLHPLLIGGLAGALPIAVVRSAKVEAAAERFAFLTSREVVDDCALDCYPEILARTSDRLAQRRPAAVANFDALRPVYCDG